MTDQFVCPEPSDAAMKAYFDAPHGYHIALKSAYAVDVPGIAMREAGRLCSEVIDEGTAAGSPIHSGLRDILYRRLAARFPAPEPDATAEAREAQRLDGVPTPSAGERESPSGWVVARNCPLKHLDALGSVALHQWDDDGTAHNGMARVKCRKCGVEARRQEGFLPSHPTYYIRLCDVPTPSAGETKRIIKCGKCDGRGTVQNMGLTARETCSGCEGAGRWYADGSGLVGAPPEEGNRGARDSRGDLRQEDPPRCTACACPRCTAERAFLRALAANDLHLADGRDLGNAEWSAKHDLLREAYIAAARKVVQGE